MAADAILLLVTELVFDLTNAFYIGFATLPLKLFLPQIGYVQIWVEILVFLDRRPPKSEFEGSKP